MPVLYYLPPDHLNDGYKNSWSDAWSIKAIDPRYSKFYNSFILKNKVTIITVKTSKEISKSHVKNEASAAYLKFWGTVHITWV